MKKTYSELYTHIVFHTRGDAQVTEGENERKLWNLIKEKLKSLEIFVIAINGMPDHLHVLVRHFPRHSISYIAQMIKGYSSHEARKENWFGEDFGWQRGYGAFSVSSSDVGRVKKYIHRQKEHHRAPSSPGFKPGAD
jgi:REP element-mobilizing transposase RayT